MRKKDYLRSAVFLFLALLLILGSAVVLDRKLACDYTTRVNGFFNEPEDSNDILCYGSSRMYCTLDPLVLHHETGLRSYVLATQQQPLAASYYYMKESFKTQSPKLVILEATMAFIPESEVADGPLRDCLDPLPWCDSKIELIKELVPKGQRSSYYFNLIKYHQRWKELSARDFDLSWMDERDDMRGYIYLTPQRGADCRRQSYDSVEARPIPPENLERLEQIARLVQQEGAELLLMAAPYEMVTDDLGYLKSLHSFCREKGIAFLDLNLVYDQLGLDEAKDFFDIGHFNVYGSIKASRYVANYIADKFTLLPQSHPIDQELRENYQLYILPHALEIDSQSLS